MVDIRPNYRPNIRPFLAEYSVSADTTFYCIGRSLYFLHNIVLRDRREGGYDAFANPRELFGSQELSKT